MLATAFLLSLCLPIRVTKHFIARYGFRFQNTHQMELPSSLKSGKETDSQEHRCNLKILPYLPLPKAKLDFMISVTYKSLPRPVARGVQGCNALSKSAKRPTFSHKMGQKCGVCKRVKGRGSKSPLFGFGGSTPPPNRSWLRA